MEKGETNEFDVLSIFMSTDVKDAPLKYFISYSTPACLLYFTKQKITLSKKL